MRLCILAGAFCLPIATAVHAQCLPSGEFLIDTARLSAPGAAWEPAVGFDGTEFLVVWLDERTGDCALFAARVSPAGEVIDPNGIMVAQDAENWRPAVAFDGTNYLVVYGENGHIRARRVSPEGTVLEPEIEVSNAGQSQENADVAFDGTNYLVVWEDYRVDNNDIYCARVSPAGVVLDTAGIPVADSLYGETMPDVCARPGGFLVVWQTEYEQRNIRAARVTSAGQVLDPNGLVLAPNAAEQVYPTVAFDGTNALAVWQDYRTGAADIYGARVTPSGTVLDSAGFLISGAGERQEFAEMAFDGTNYILVWEDYRNNTWVGDIYAARVTPEAQVLDPAGIPVQVDTFYEQTPALASGGNVSLLLWTGWPPPALEADVQMKRVSAAGVVLDSTPTSVAAYCPYQWDPAVAFDGTNYLVVWEDDRNGSFEADIHAARVSPTGQTLDPTCIPVCTEEGWQEHPAVAFDGVNYVVAWQDKRDGQPDICAARVTPEGELVDTQAIHVAWESADDECYPTVVAGDTVTLVAWEYERRDIEGRRVGRSGQVLDPDVIEISPDERGRMPASAFDGTDFLVVFHDDRSDTVDIFDTKVGQDGSVINAEFRISVGVVAGEREPRAAFDGTNYLVVWQTERPGNWEIRATRLTPACAVLDSPSIFVDQTGRNESDADQDVVFDGTGFVVVWEDLRLGPETTDICGARVSTGGQVLERFPAVRQPASQYVPRLAHGSGNQLLLVYEGWTTTYQGRLFNTDHIWGKFSPLLAVEDSHGAPGRGLRPTATIVRRALVLGAVDSRQNKGYGAELLDISGRKALELAPGPNDVSRLAPGVYFVTGSIDRAAPVVRRVVVTR
jgi:hypothetical protein